MSKDERHPQQQLVDACRNFLRLIDSPQPGLFTWNVYVRDAVKEIQQTVNAIRDPTQS